MTEQTVTTPRLTLDGMAAYKTTAEPIWAISRDKGGDGYDTADDVRTEGWRAIDSWGRDGWTLLEWPYYMGYQRQRAGRFDFATNCEGDVEVYSFPTEALRTEAIDAIAWWHWKLKAAGHVARYTEPQAEHRGAFSWGRLDRESGSPEQMQ